MKTKQIVSVVPEIGGHETKYTVVNVENFFANLKLKPGRIFRFIAVLKGTTRANQATIVFEYSKKLKCGTSLTSIDGKKYVIVERKITTPIVGQQNPGIRI